MVLRARAEVIPGSIILLPYDQSVEADVDPLEVATYEIYPITTIKESRCNLLVTFNHLKSLEEPFEKPFVQNYGKEIHCVLDGLIQGSEMELFNNGLLIEYITLEQVDAVLEKVSNIILKIWNDKRPYLQSQSDGDEEYMYGYDLTIPFSSVEIGDNRERCLGKE